MSKHKSNVHPGHYKVAGRERQGEDVVHDQHKAWLAQIQVGLGKQPPYPDWAAAAENPMPEKEALEHDEAAAARAGRKRPAARARARTKVSKRKGRRALSRTALARQGRSSARKRTSAQRPKAARKASRTRARSR
jgi:hypothetical protein